MRNVVVGDQSCLVDQLIASSQLKAPAGANYQGFGRALIPFDFEQHDVSPGKPGMMGALEDGKKGRRNAPKSYKFAPKKVRVQSIFAQPQPQQPQSRSPRRQTKKQTSQAEESYPTAPGFSQSPKPEAIPLPTLSLLQKALARAELCKVATHEQAIGSLTAVHVAAA